MKEGRWHGARWTEPGKEGERGRRAHCRTGSKGTRGQLTTTLLVCASFMAAFTRLLSSSGPASMASWVTSTALGSWFPDMTTLTVSSSSYLQEGRGEERRRREGQGE